MEKTILEHAKEIYQDRREEKERQYGSFEDSIKNTSTMASLLAGHSISMDDCYAVLIALKLSRQGHAHKYDNILDGIVYLAAWNDSKQITQTFQGYADSEKPLPETNQPVPKYKLEAALEERNFLLKLFNELINTSANQLSQKIAVIGVKQFNYNTTEGYTLKPYSERINQKQ